MYNRGNGLGVGRDSRTRGRGVPAVDDCAIVYLQAEAGLQTWPRKRPGTTHTLWMRYELEGVGRILPTPPPLTFPVPRYQSSDHPNTPPPMVHFHFV